jgi:6-phosphofructokinase 1
MFSASVSTVAQIVVNYLNEVGLATKGAAGQRSRHRPAPQYDLRLDGRPGEAYQLGQKAALIAVEDGSGFYVDHPAPALNLQCLL